MVVETFKPGKTDEVYERFYEKGRMLPSGMRYVDSWLSSDRTKCFQLMETDKMELFDEWIGKKELLRNAVTSKAKHKW
jgi:hypothetical protein